MTDEELLDELLSEGSLTIGADEISERATNEVSCRRINACRKCSFYMSTVCMRGNFSAYKQAADANAKCPESKW